MPQDKRRHYHTKRRSIACLFGKVVIRRTLLLPDKRFLFYQHNNRCYNSESNNTNYCRFHSARPLPLIKFHMVATEFNLPWYMFYAKKMTPGVPFPPHERKQNTL